MKKITYYDTKPYDRLWADRLAQEYGFKIKYLESKLNADTAYLARGADAITAFVNDTVDAAAIAALCAVGVSVLALRSAGFNNVDFQAAYGKLHVMRVPAYSPHAVAEHAMALLLALDRNIPRAYNRTRDFNFSIRGLTGFDLHGKTVGVVGMGRIGRVFAGICRGFSMKVLAYDPFPLEEQGVEYVPLDTLIRQSDVISLHCPLTAQTYHMIGGPELRRARHGVIIINTSRGALIDSAELIEALKDGRVGGAGLDVYEEESELFFEDYSDRIVQDDVLARLVTMPNVLLTAHQAFLTDEALENIARATFENLRTFFRTGTSPNEICYQCDARPECGKDHAVPCFGDAGRPE